jgi:hypothetical protein
VVSEAMVRQIVGVEGAQALIEITDGAWQDHIDERRPRFHRATRAHVVWDHMVQRSDALLVGMEGVERIERQTRPLYVLRGLIAIRPKLHTRDATTRNYPTKAQRNARASGLFPDTGFQNVTFGYRLDRAEAGIEQYVITSPADTWLIDLQELASGELRPIAGMFDMPDIEEPWRNIPGIRFRNASQ